MLKSTIDEGRKIIYEGNVKRRNECLTPKRYCKCGAPFRLGGNLYAGVQFFNKFFYKLKPKA